MKQIDITAIVIICCALNSVSQTTNSITGRVVSASYEKPLKGVIINIDNTSISSETTINGEFRIENIPTGEYVIQFIFENSNQITCNVIGFV